MIIIGSFFGFLLFLSTLLIRAELKKMKISSPGIFSKAGIVEIDWWWNCLRGICRLGFTSIGNSLSPWVRVLFKAYVVIYASFAMIILIIVLEKLF